LQSDEDETRKAAAIALGRIGDPNSTQALIEMIGENEDLTIFVIGSLAKLGVSEAFEPLLKQLGNPNPSIRRATIAALNSIGHPEMPTRIQKLLETGTSLELESAIQIAGYFGYQNCKNLIKKCIENPDIKISCAAIENLPFFEDESSIDILVKLYTEGSTRVRASVVKAVRHIDSKDNRAVLATSLNDEDPWVRYYAIRSISNLYQKEHLFKLMLMAKSDPAIQVRMAAIETIGLMDGTEAVGILSELTQDENTDIVLASIYALGMLDTKESLQLLFAFIDDYDAAKKLTAIKAIGRFNKPEVAEKLYLIASREDKNKQFANAAIESLSGILLKQATNYLLKLSDQNHLTQKCIAALLKQKHFALPILNELFKMKSSPIQRNIIEFLSRAKTPEATKSLVLLLEDDTAQIRIDAMRALYRIGYQDITEITEKISLTDPDVYARYYAKEILKKK
ncbi:MAG: HEAT repeat domain-containing protein, partial [Bacteroidota bacterium]